MEINKKADEKKGRKLFCCHCQVEMIDQTAAFSYLGRTFHTEAPCCPQCGLTFVSRDLAKGRMAQVEESLEDK